MSRGKNSDSGRRKARSVARYTIYNVTQPAEADGFSDAENGGNQS